MMQIVVTLVLALFSLLAGYGYGVKDGAQHVQAKLDAEKAATISAQRDKEAELQANMDKLRTEKNRETAKLRNTVAALTDSLRDRPERPASAASGAGDGASGCTGAGLYRSDSEFLVRLAERADRIRLALKDCQNAYENASH